MTRMPLKHVVLGVTVLGTFLAACEFAQADSWRRAQRRARRLGYNACQPVHVDPCCAGYGQAYTSGQGYYNGHVYNQGYSSQGGQQYYSSQPRQMTPVPASGEYSTARPTYQQDQRMNDRYDDSAPAPPRAGDNEYFNDQRGTRQNRNQNWDNNDRAVPPAPGLSETEDAVQQRQNNAVREADEAVDQTRNQANEAADDLREERRDDREAADELNNEVRQQRDQINSELNSERNELLNEQGSSDADGTRIEADSGIDAAAAKED